MPMTHADHAERGATAVLFASLTLLLFGMLAIAVDIGAGFGERRLDQIASDSAALGGSLEMVISDPNGAPVAAAVQRVYELVNTNLDRTIPYSDPGGAPDWESCSDPGRLFYSSKNAVFNVANGSDCISFSEDFNTFRVRIPDQELDTAFGGIIGFPILSVDAVAEAARNSDFGGGGDFPSGALGGAALGNVLCLKTDNGSSAPAHQACGDPSTGDFGNFRPYFYGAIDGDNSSICVSGEQVVPMSRAMAEGIDHDFSFWTSGNDRINGHWCEQSGIPGPFRPNMVDPTGGYSNNDITFGLIQGGSWPTGSATYTGRLTRGPFVDNTAYTFSFGGSKAWLDNKPLWEYIDLTTAMSTAALDTACTAVATSGHIVESALPPGQTVAAEYSDRLTATLDCLNEALTGIGGPYRILTADLNSNSTPDILESPRLATVPVFVETAPLGSNACCYHIADVAPVFIDSVYSAFSHVSFSCSGLAVDNPASPTVCSHHAGIDGSMNVNPPGQKKIMSAGSIVLDCALLPAGTCSSLPNPSDPLTGLYDLTLTK